MGALDDSLKAITDAHDKAKQSEMDKQAAALAEKFTAEEKAAMLRALGGTAAPPADPPPAPPADPPANDPPANDPPKAQNDAPPAPHADPPKQQNDPSGGKPPADGGGGGNSPTLDNMLKGDPESIAKAIADGSLEKAFNATVVR